LGGTRICTERLSPRRDNRWVVEQDEVRWAAPQQSRPLSRILRREAFFGQHGSLIPAEFGSSVLKPHLHSGLSEVHPAGEVLSHEGVWVVCPLKDALQSLQLAAVERRPVPPLLSLFLFLGVQLIIWSRRNGC